MSRALLVASFPLVALPVAAMICGSALANGTDPFPYVGVKGQPACPVDSNADKINRAIPLDNDPKMHWPIHCERCISHALEILDPKVVGDVLPDGKSEPPKRAEWSLKYLLTQIGLPRGPGSALKDVFDAFHTEQIVNGFKVDPRPDLDTFITRPWVKRAGAQDFDDLIARLDGKVGADDTQKTANQNKAWEAAPYKLVAIGYRPDLVKFDVDRNQISSGGEGRFIFQAINNGQFLAQTIILEYRLPATDAAGVKDWVNEFNKLRLMENFDDTYLNELARITKRFTDRDVRKPVPNNISLGQLRTNELFFPGAFDWELREFHISGKNKLEQTAVQMTPDLSFNNKDNPVDTKLLTDYLNSAEFQGAFPNTTIPWSFNGRALVGGSAFTPASFINLKFGTGGTDQPVEADKVDTWLKGVFNDEDKRSRFAASTCNGCHGGDAPRTTDLKNLDGVTKENVLVPLRSFQTGCTHVDGRGVRAGHVTNAIMSDFMCSSDLVARADVFEAFLQIPDAVVNALPEAVAKSRQKEKRIFSLETSDVLASDTITSLFQDMTVANQTVGLSALAVLVRNQSRPH